MRVRETCLGSATSAEGQSSAMATSFSVSHRGLPNRRDEITASCHTPEPRGPAGNVKDVADMSPRVLAAAYSSVPMPPTLILTAPPPPFCIPKELLQCSPGPDDVFRYFFKGHPNEVRIRRIFFHTELTDQEQAWLRNIREYCQQRQLSLGPGFDPFLLRLVYYNWRKHGERTYLAKSYDHIGETLKWRAQTFPISDTEPEIAEDLKKGVMYWAARDASLRPLLIIRLRRLPRPCSAQRFKRLTVFCFEWAIRYLFIPGIVETCRVLFDVRGLPVHSIPMSSLADMTGTLTRQYPFRLEQMFIINDSLLIQTVWSIARQFLSDVQQQKMCFLRANFAQELLKVFAAHQLEPEFGGTRETIECFYPFPLLPGPFNVEAKSTDPNAVPNCHEAIDAQTVQGCVWEGDVRTPIQWSIRAPIVFTRCGIPPLMMGNEPQSPSTDVLVEETEREAALRSQSLKGDVAGSSILHVGRKSLGKTFQEGHNRKAPPPQRVVASSQETASSSTPVTQLQEIVEPHVDSRRSVTAAAYPKADFAAQCEAEVLESTERCDSGIPLAQTSKGSFKRATSRHSTALPVTDETERSIAEKDDDKTSFKSADSIQGTPATSVQPAAPLSPQMSRVTQCPAQMKPQAFEPAADAPRCEAPSPKSKSVATGCSWHMLCCKGKHREKSS